MSVDKMAEYLPANYCLPGTNEVHFMWITELHYICDRICENLPNHLLFRTEIIM